MPPRVHYMDWQAPRHYQHDVKPHIGVAQLGPARPHIFRGAFYTPALFTPERGRRLIDSRARLDFDERDHPPAARDDIDLADRCSQIARQDAIPLEAQHEDTQGLGPAAGSDSAAAALFGHAGLVN